MKYSYLLFLLLIVIHSFILVGNVSYFFEIGNFFIPEDVEWKKHSIEDLPDVVNSEEERKFEIMLSILLNICSAIGSAFSQDLLSICSKFAQHLLSNFSAFAHYFQFRAP